LFLISTVWKIAPRWHYSEPSVTIRGSGDVLTVAATGDSVVFNSLPSSQADPGFAGTLSVLQNANLAITDLEENLLDSSNVPRADSPDTVRWPHGTKSQAEDLKRAGFAVVSLANDHALDYGEDGLDQTRHILDEVGLLHAGSGDDLEEARAPVYIGTAAPRRVAVISIAISAASESRATYAHGEILGRPGISTLKYAPDVTVDPGTFATLKKSPAAVPDEGNPSPDRLMLSGTPVKKGAQTVVEFVPDNSDADDIFSRIRIARSKSDVVIVMLHSHEPSNQSQSPADFMQRFARAMVDAGANLVVGDGPHQLRRIEVYKGAAILYSLGNFIFDYGSVDPRSLNLYDDGADLYRLAIGAFGESEVPPPPKFDDAKWWEGAMATATFQQGALRSLELRPIDLGSNLPLAQRGTPRLATGDRADEILQRLNALSNDLGTQIRIENGIGFVDIGSQSK
jgi:poly-gamma-glutamate capsule biosynthesis protein CapA/YwtB (metallophosphatase superfamily)